MNDVLNIMGITNESGRWYALWSGIGGDAAFLAAPLILWRKHNCHVKGCWRIGRHPVQGTTWTVCRSHHPGDHPTAADVIEASR